jgi:predicted RecB family nuclease
MLRTIHNEVILAEVVSAYRHCPRKAFLLHRAENPCKPNEYGRLVEERAKANKASYLAALEHANISVCAYNDRAISEGCDVLTDANIEAANVRAHCDLRASVHEGRICRMYEPTIVLGTYGVTKEQIVNLAVAGYVLQEFQGKPSTRGYLVTLDGRSHRVNLRPLLSTVGSILEKISVLLNETAEPPPIILNKHCPYCPFKNACYEQAEAVDDLSLLNGMPAKAIQQYHSKGIFTVHQLSYTFRPRRYSKRAKPTGRSHNFSLQAMAIRDQKVYVVEPPVLMRPDTQVYVDMEGDPDGCFVYLIGMLVVCDGQESYQSFWADARQDEAAIIEQFDRAVSALTNPRLFHYGSYESRVLKRAASRLPLESKLNHISSTAWTNVLSQIYSRIYFPTRSNSLKNIGSYLGHVWRTPGATGLDAMAWRGRWE